MLRRITKYRSCQPLHQFLQIPNLSQVFLFDLINTETHGRFHQMVKNSKKKREDKMSKVKLQIENKKVQEYLEDQEKRILNLKEELHEYKESLLEAEKDSAKLMKLYQDNYIDLNGDPIHE